MTSLTSAPNPETDQSYLFPIDQRPRLHFVSASSAQFAAPTEWRPTVKIAPAGVVANSTLVSDRFGVVIVWPIPRSYNYNGLNLDHIRRIPEVLAGMLVQKDLTTYTFREFLARIGIYEPAVEEIRNISTVFAKPISVTVDRIYNPIDKNEIVQPFWLKYRSRDYQEGWIADHRKELVAKQAISPGVIIQAEGELVSSSLLAFPIDGCDQIIPPQSSAVNYPTRVRFNTHGMGIVLPTSEMRSANPKRAIQDLARAMFYISRKLRGEVPKPEILEKLIQQN